MLAGVVLLASVRVDAQTAAAGDAATGSLYGRVVDGAGQPLPSVEISVEGSMMRAATDLNGRYSIAGLPEGLHALLVRSLGYTAKTVTNVEIRAGSATQVDVTLYPTVVELEGITVTAEAERGSAVALIEERRAASFVVDAIGSEQIARSPDSDAAAALRRVTGLSIVDDRYVYVRGLGDRYSSAQLNGTPLASPEPDRKAIPLDMFPSDLLESVVTAKTYSPDKPGDYAGGLIDIQTKSFPGQRTFRMSLGTSYGTITSLQSGLGYTGGNLDFLGFDDGTRAIPDAVPTDTKILNTDLTNDEIAEIGRSFEPVWEPRSRTVPVDAKGSVSFADQTSLFGMPTGVLLSGTYSNSYDTRELLERIIVLSDEVENYEVDYSGTQTSRNVSWSTMAEVDFLASRSTQLSVRGLYTRTAEDLARDLFGYNADRSANTASTRLMFTGRSVWSAGLEAEHFLDWLADSRLEWRLGYGGARTDEPDRREVVYDETDEGLAWRELTNSGTRYYTEMRDRDLSAGLDLAIPLGYTSQLKVGGAWVDNTRDFFTRRFRYRGASRIGAAQFLPADSLFDDPNIAPDKLALQEDTRRTDNYDASKEVLAGYAMLEFPLGSQLKFSGGARLERVRQKVLPYDLFPLGLPPVDSAVLDNTDILPGVNLTWSPTQAMNIRAAASQTVARPEYRELAPFDFIDFVGGFLQVGNPSLTRTLIRNLDLRWEIFPSPGALFAVSGFYKNFIDPIEAVVFPSSELIATWDNNREAQVYGLEFEARTSLGVLARGLSNFYFSGNLSLIESSVQMDSTLRLPSGETIAVVPRERALQGQSPYTINAALTYFLPATGTTLSGMYNRFGRRISQVGTQQLPDIFEQSRNQLDVVLEQDLGRRLRLKATVSNLLGESPTYEQNGTIVRQSIVGRRISVSFSFGTGS